MTVVWHADDLKVLHKDLFEVTRLAAYLTGIYDDMKVNSEKLYKYLGMDLY